MTLKTRLYHVVLTEKRKTVIMVEAESLQQAKELAMLGEFDNPPAWEWDSISTEIDEALTNRLNKVVKPRMRTWEVATA